MVYTRPYLKENAIAYARKWALAQNPLFFNYSGLGGDCTNFVSQCILAGSCKMNFTRDFGWYYVDDSNRAPAWTGVEYFYDFMTQSQEFASQNMGIGPFGISVSSERARPGDAVQISNELGDFYHTLFVTDVRGTEIYVCAHSDNALDRPLSTYEYSESRFIRILGVRVDYDTPCFEPLYNGTAIIFT